jgi:acyl-CoA synthetase (AMP-forming)/AMP-acid ligase II/3-oxoacyl-(acyl-carrier-protein) synthase
VYAFVAGDAGRRASDCEGEADSDAEGSSSVLSLGDLDLKARALAASLQARGLEGQRALLVFSPGLEFISAFFGCLYAGVVAVPASPPRRNRPATRLEAIAADARPDVLLTSLAQRPVARQWQAAIPGLAGAEWLGVDSLAIDLAARWQPAQVGPDTLAFLQYTSGSTAAPKGVMVSHGNLMRNSALINRSFRADASSRGVFWLPLFHDMGLIGGVLQTLYCGGYSTLLSPVAFLRRPLGWLEAIAQTGATISGAPNFAYDLCVRKVTDAHKAQLDLSRWSVAFNGAEPVRAETLERFAEAFAPCGFRGEAFLPCYGLAESTLMVTGKRAELAPTVATFRGAELGRDKAVAAARGESDARTLVSSGQVFDGLRVEAVDPETALPCPEGQVGEIWASGPSVAQGYWNQAEATAEVFGARLASGDGPFLRTGDLGFLQGNELFVTGRSKDVMIVRGRNVYPQDIEWSVAGCHPLARPEASAAFSIEAGGRERLVVVQEVDRLGKANDVAEVVASIRRAVAEEHDLDVHAVCLIKPLRLPKTSSGKVQRQACREAFLAGTLGAISTSVLDLDEPAAEHESSVAHAARKRPAAEIEQWLVERIAATAGLDRAALDVRRPFAAFGLGSVQAVALAAALEEWLGQPLSATLVYDHPTIPELARFLAGEEEPTGQERGIGRAQQANAGEREPIAVVGLGCRFPCADGSEEFWRLLHDGVDAVSKVPESRWDVREFFHPDPATPGKMNTCWGGFLDQVDLFDPHFFGVAPREAARMDPQHRLLLEVAWETFEHAGLVPGRLAGSRTGVFVGISGNDYGRLQAADPGRIDAYVGTGNAFSVAANRISHLWDFRAPSLAVDTACSSSLVAVHLACESLRRGESDLALAGGVNLTLTPELTVALSQARMTAGEGRCKTFDAAADGYVRGEGCGMVLLKRLRDALRDGDPVLAVVKGTAVNHDGRSNGLTAPSGRAQQAVIREALDDAGVAPGQVGFVETHGTGTALGDPIEFEALSAVLSAGRPPGRPCVLGAVKTNIGHLEAAAGIAGFIKAVLALWHGEIPRNLHFRELNPHISPDGTPFVFPTGPTPWPPSDGLRLAGVSSFGFGGTNAHVILEEAPAPAAPLGGEPPSYVLALSARTETALRALAERYEAFLAAQPAEALAEVCATANAGRTAFEYRLAVVAENPVELRQRLAAAAAGGPAPGIWRGRAAARTSPAGPDPSGRDDRVVTAHSLAELFANGVAVDWAGFHRGPLRKRAGLPTYPFERERYWFDPTKDGATEASSGGARPRTQRDHHPLLDRPVELAHPPGVRVWETELSRGRFPYLGGHRIQGATVLPMAFYIEMAQEAAAEAFGAGRYRLAQLELRALLVEPDQGAVRVRVVLSPEGPGAAAFSVSSRAEPEPGPVSGPDGRPSQDWHLHATGAVVVD